MNQPIEAEMLESYVPPSANMLVFSGTAEAQDQLILELAGAMADFAPIFNADTGAIGNRSFKYASLDLLRAATMPALLKRKIVVLQPLTGPYGGSTYRLTTMVRGHKAGISATIEFEGDEDLQAFGKQQTYLRRYAYRAMFLLDGSDDPDNGGGETQKFRDKPPPTARPVPTAQAPTKAELQMQIQSLLLSAGFKANELQAEFARHSGGRPSGELSVADLAQIRDTLKAGKVAP